MESEEIVSTDQIVEVKDLSEVENSISELVDAITNEQELKEQEKVLLEEEKALLQEQELKEGQKEEEFKTEVMSAIADVSNGQIDYTDQLNALNGQLVLMTEELTQIKEYQNYTTESDHVISIYGLIVIPGVLIVLFFWKMIKAFI